jgi:predicted metal-dependent HD superfamily phosphohydrolase
VNFGFWNRIGAQGDPDPVYARLVARYSEPHRAYHNLAHIEHCLDEFESSRELATDANSIEMAIWYHDVVYDPRAKDNEQRSADVAVEVARDAKLPTAFTQRVADLILATRHIAPPSDPDAAILVDVDLSILGQPAERFDAYERQIRQEYDWVEAAAFAEGRGAILKSFLERAAIFSTPFFWDKYERQARENLKRSIERLQGAPA